MPASIPPVVRARGSARHGGALVGVLIVLFWLTGVTGWLVAHVAFSDRQDAQESQLAVLAAAADGMAGLAASRLAHETDWGVLVNAAVPTPCPGTAAVVVPASAIAEDTVRWQATSDAVARWPVGVRATWRAWLACDARGLLPGWRGSEPTPWVFALVADDPDGSLLDGTPAQLFVAVVAGRGDARVRRVVTVRRGASSHPRVVAWRPG